MWLVAEVLDEEDVGASLSLAQLLEVEPRERGLLPERCLVRRFRELFLQPVSRGAKGSGKIVEGMTVRNAVEHGGGEAPAHKPHSVGPLDLVAHIDPAPVDKLHQLSVHFKVVLKALASEARAHAAGISEGREVLLPFLGTGERLLPVHKEV